uniref:Uncharacterized protein n=1 Tax=Rhizophora mucronata TaxID=61149 RepID=A0A2P2NQ94_RHIMU
MLILVTWRNLLPWFRCFQYLFEDIYAISWNSTFMLSLAD